MNPILITGGTGHLGGLIATTLATLGRPSRIMTRNPVSSPSTMQEFHFSDLANNNNLQSVLENVDTIIHCASNPADFQQVDIEGTQHLLNAIGKRPIRNFVYISIVGVDRSLYPYYVAKLEVEKRIAKAGIPYTIVRATQFDSFIVNIIRNCLAQNDATNPYLILPAGMRFQPITTQEVASLLVTLSQEKALDGIVEAGGPEVRDFESLAKAYLDIKGYDRPIKLVNTDHPRHRLFRTGINLCPDRKVGQITWEQYLESVL